VTAPTTTRTPVAPGHRTGPPGERLDPRLLAALGSFCIALSSMFIKLSDTSGSTSGFWRCACALPVLAALAWWERRRAGTGVRRRVVLPLAAGALLGVDFVCWGEAIPRVGAGIATVLLAVQVVIVPGLAFVFLRERPSRRYFVAIPVLLGGIVLAGGVTDNAAFGPDPVSGTVAAVVAGTAYAGYLLLIRIGTGPGTQVHSLCLATVSAGAVAVLSGVTGLAGHGIDLTPGWPAAGWLVALALVGHVAGWLLIVTALPRMSAAAGATLMLLQPVGAVLLGIGLLGETPSALQLTGCAAVLATVCFTGDRAKAATSRKR
jgi:drug/metabolite transporter (DMT)-like permease